MLLIKPVARRIEDMIRQDLDVRDFMPGGIINYPPRAAECKGCGAPLRAHTCDYCKRTTQ